MKVSLPVLAALFAAGIAGCGQSGDEPVESAEAVTENIEEQAVSEENSTEEQTIEVAPGLTARILQRGYGRAAEAGDYVEVHYTGWLYDAAAEDQKGRKFDSSVDRGQPFRFPLGGGRVIEGWDQGVAGMKVGGKRRLVIPADMAYGQRGAGNVIPPGATLVFDVELLGLE